MGDGGSRNNSVAGGGGRLGEHARELTNVGMFLEGLRARFEDETRAQSAEGEIAAIKQRGRSSKEYVREFRKITGRLRAWPKRLLIHQFHMGLDRDLRQACVYRGLPPHLVEWFKAVIDMDRGLQEFRGRGEAKMMYPRRTVDRIPPKRETPSAVPKPRGEDSARRLGFRCFRCDQEGHRVADCPLPPPRLPGLQPSVTGDTARVQNRPTSERTRLARQTTPVKNKKLGKDVGGSSEEGVGQFPLVAEESDEEAANDLMVSRPVRPFVIPVMIQNTCTAMGCEQGALIDSGCTRCLIRRYVVEGLVIQVRKLHTPIKF